jgi:hypothetical protein
VIQLIHCTRAAAAAALIACLSFSARSAAQQGPSPADIKKAAAAFDLAKEAYNAGDYETAAQQFERADEHAPSPVALQWAIDANDQGAQLARAATLAALAKDRHPDDSDLMDVANGVLEKANVELHLVRVSCDALCSVLVNNKLIYGRANRVRLVYLEEGEHSLSASFSEDSGSEPSQLVASAGGRTELSLSPARPEEAEKELPPGGMDDPFADDEPIAEDPVADEGPKEESSGWSPAVFWVGVGLTVVGGATSVWSGLDTKENPGVKRYEDACDPVSGDRDECKALYEEGAAKEDRTNLLVGVTAGVGLLTILVGAVFTDWGSAEPEKKDDADDVWSRATPSGVSVAPWVAFSDGAIVGATARF